MLVVAGPLLRAVDIRIRDENDGRPTPGVQVPRGIALGRPHSGVDPRDFGTGRSTTRTGRAVRSSSSTRPHGRGEHTGS
ncbi:hypothetical protein A4U64_23500 [Rhodococcus sp. WB1]|nr:hypothetical protein A4U64_23500 [Rhodococcus sp. WB1]PND50394.1 hypothetical protein CQZ88_19685 [Rhodococcus sp. ENV425]CCW14358.1 hypothetical protein EBESD8_49270 [Rhodococcus aetherivorans]